MGYEWQPGLRGSWLILKKLKVSLGSKDKMTYMTITNREQSPPNCNSGGHLGVNDNMNCDRTAISKSLNDRTFTSDPIKDENGPNQADVIMKKQKSAIVNDMFGHRMPGDLL